MVGRAVTRRQMGGPAVLPTNAGDNIAHDGRGLALHWQLLFVPVEHATLQVGNVTES